MEKEEFSKLARQMRADLMALSRRFLGDETEAEDNVQDVLLRLWRLCVSWDLQMSPSYWPCRMTRIMRAWRGL